MAKKSFSIYLGFSAILYHLTASISTLKSLNLGATPINCKCLPSDATRLLRDFCITRF